MPLNEEGSFNPDPFIFSHSGQKIGPAYDAPSLEDIAISLGRICRFAGHGLRFWSVLQHSFVVADLLEKEYQAIGLLHDASESLISDIPTPLKSPDMRDLEARILHKIFHHHLGIFQMNPNVWKKVKVADSEAFAGECWVVGTAALRDLYTDRSKTAEKLVRKYLKKYPIEDCVSSEGNAVIDFVRKVKSYQ